MRALSSPGLALGAQVVAFALATRRVRDAAAQLAAAQRAREAAEREAAALWERINLSIAGAR